MDETEQLVAGYFHLCRSLKRKKRPVMSDDDPIIRAIRRRLEMEQRAELRQARLEWAEDRDEWERQFR